MSDGPYLSVCIPTRNRSRLLKEAIESLLRQAYPIDRIELLVFDDASTAAESREIARVIEEFLDAGFARVHLERSDRNVKMLAARQSLSDATSPVSELLLFLDDDGELTGETLPVLVDTIRSGEKIAAVGPRILTSGSPPKVLHGAYFVGGWTGFYKMIDASVPTPCDWLNSTCVLVRKAPFRQVGGFDVSFGQSQAEADLCLKLKRAGYVVLYQPNAVAVHKLPSTDARRDRLYHLYRNKLWLIRRHFTPLRRLAALSLHVVLGTPRHLWESFTMNRGVNAKECTAILRAVWNGLFDGRTDR